MKTITVKLEHGALYTPYCDGVQVSPGTIRLTFLRDYLVSMIGADKGRVVLLRPSRPGQTSPVTLYDHRPERNYAGGPWTR